MRRTLHIVDVFAESRYAGNQLAVISDPGELTGETMQAIAREMNFSETTFVTSGPDEDGGWGVRIFTPAAELPFAGHPTLGTAWVIRRHLADGVPSSVRLNLGVGQVPVAFEASDDGGELAWLTAPPVTLGRELPAEVVAPALSLAPEDLDERGPAQLVSAGFPTHVVPVRGLAALRRSRLDPAAFPALEREGIETYFHLFCDETRSPENDLSARFYFVAGGVREDPATGSATACLGAYLLAHDFLGRPELDLRVEQGHEIERPSLLRLRARRGDAGPEIRVGGRVLPVAEGRLL